jgi:hypothetical protein
MALTPVVKAILGRRAALASWIRWKAAATRRSAVEEIGRKSNRHRRRLAGELRGDGDRRRGIASDQQLQRAQRFGTSGFDLPERVAIRTGVRACHRHIFVAADADVQTHLREPHEILGLANGVARRVRLQLRLGGDEPESRHGARQGLAGIFVIERDPRGVGGNRSAAGAHARPQVELPIDRQHGALEAAAVARQLSTAASEQVGRRPQLRASLLGGEHGLLHARGAGQQVGTARNAFGHRRGQLLVAETRDPPADDQPRGRAYRSEAERNGQRRILLERLDIGRRFDGARADQDHHGQRRGKPARPGQTGR